MGSPDSRVRGLYGQAILSPELRSSSVVAALVVALDGTILAVNDVLVNLVGRRVGELVRADACKVLFADPDGWAAFKAAANDSAGGVTVHLKTSDERIIVLRGDVESIGKVGRQPSLRGVFVDATDVLGLLQESRLRYTRELLLVDRRAAAAAEIKTLLSDVAASGELGGVLLGGRDVLRALTAADWRGELEWTELATLRGWAERFGGAEAAQKAAPDDALDEGPLSARELQVLARIAAGDSNKVIARALDLSPHTVKRHVAPWPCRLESRGSAAIAHYGCTVQLTGQPA